MNVNKKQVVKAIEFLSLRVSAVRRIAGVRRWKPRFAESTSISGEARFGLIVGYYASIHIFTYTINIL